MNFPISVFLTYLLFTFAIQIASTNILFKRNAPSASNNGKPINDANNQSKNDHLTGYNESLVAPKKIIINRHLNLIDFQKVKAIQHFEISQDANATLKHNVPKRQPASKKFYKSAKNSNVNKQAPKKPALRSPQNTEITPSYTFATPTLPISTPVPVAPTVPASIELPIATIATRSTPPIIISSIAPNQTIKIFTTPTLPPGIFPITNESTPTTNIDTTSALSTTTVRWIVPTYDLTQTTENFTIYIPTAGPEEAPMTTIPIVTNPEVTTPQINASTTGMTTQIRPTVPIPITPQLSTTTEMVSLSTAKHSTVKSTENMELVTTPSIVTNPASTQPTKMVQTSTPNTPNTPLPPGPPSIPSFPPAKPPIKPGYHPIHPVPPVNRPVYKPGINFPPSLSKPNEIPKGSWIKAHPSQQPIFPGNNPIYGKYPNTGPGVVQPPQYTGECPEEVESIGCYYKPNKMFKIVIKKQKVDQSLEEFFCECGEMVEKKGWTIFVLSESACYSSPLKSGFDVNGLSRDCVNDAGDICTDSDTYCQGLDGSMSVYMILNTKRHKMNRGAM